MKVDFEADLLLFNPIQIFLQRFLTLVLWGLPAALTPSHASPWQADVWLLVKVGVQNSQFKFSENSGCPRSPFGPHFENFRSLFHLGKAPQTIFLVFLKSL